MSGAFLPSRSEDPRPSLNLNTATEDDDEIFKSLVVTNPPPRSRRARITMRASAIVHVILVAVLVLVPLLLPAPPPPRPDYIRALIYDPPPPPPPPLPKGSALVQKQEPARPTTPDPNAEKPKFVTPETPTHVPDLKPEARVKESEQAGSPTGSDFGVPEGMEGGVEGGVVGGTLGGVLGGVLGGTGTSPVMDYDQPPRPIKMVKPQYPQDAFVKKIEGVVEVEILIDSTGRVIQARVVRSIAQLDAAALQTVYQWIFSPAVKHGRPVATVARAPVTFRIF
jgi:periplasmic protein TonB